MRKLQVLVLSAIIAVAGLVVFNITGTKSEAASCDANNVVNCGTPSVSALKSAYAANKGDVRAIYAHYGITADMISKVSNANLGEVHKDGRITLGGKTVATGAHSIGRKDVYKPSTKVTINGKTYYAHEPKDTFAVESIKAFVFLDKDGKFIAAILTECGNPFWGTPKPVPTYKCDALSATKITRDEYSFSAKASAKDGASISGYTFDFGDGKTASQAASSVKHTYAKAGTYKVKVSVQVKVSGSTKMVTSKECETTITVKEKPATPVYSCDALAARVIKLEGRSYAYDLTFTAKDGATLTDVDFDFGDGQKKTVEAAGLENVSHTYAKAGEYTTAATLHFSVTEEGKKTVKDVNCETKISITPEACPLNPSLPKGDEGCTPCEVPGKEQYPKDSPKCASPCEVPGKEQYPKDSDQCAETPVELPHTGAGDILGGGLGLSAIIAAGYYWYASRRGLIDALMNR